MARVVLCGSDKFESLFIEANKQLSLHLHTVYGMAILPSQGGDKDWYTPSQKVILDLVHLSKILHSDCMVILDKDGYIGHSTAREIVWASILHKPYICYSNFPDNWPRISEWCKKTDHLDITAYYKALSVLAKEKGE